MVRCTRAASYGGELSLVAPSRSVNAMYPTVNREHVLRLASWRAVASGGQGEAFLWCRRSTTGVRRTRAAQPAGAAWTRRAWNTLPTRRTRLFSNIAVGFLSVRTDMHSQVCAHKSVRAHKTVRAHKSVRAHERVRTGIGRHCLAAVLRLAHEHARTVHASEL